jgi:hypothetical protein
MKTKRMGHLLVSKKNSQSGKKAVNGKLVMGGSAVSQAEGKTDNQVDCTDCCSISWKPSGTAR